MTIESLKFVRAVVGFVRAGVIVQPALTARAAQIVDQMKSAPEQGEAGATHLARTERLLQVVRSSILPSQAACTASMAEIDAVLAPLRQAQRAAQAQAHPQSQDTASTSLSDDAPADRPAARERC